MSAAAEAVAALRKRNEDAWKLAVLASTAVQVEPELLRRLRLELLPDSDASAEADLWLSDLVDSKSPDAAVLRTDVRTVLQQELAADPARRDAAAAIVAKLHDGHSTVIQLQEQVTALMLRNDAASRTEIEKLLQPIVRTLHESDHSGLARWAARAFGQLQPGVQLMQTPWLMIRAASLRLRGQSSGVSGAPAAGWSAVESSLRELPLVAVYVKMRRDGVTLTTVEGEGARLDIPATEPLLLEFAWDGPQGRESGRVAFAQGTEAELPLVPRNVVVTTLLGTEYEIRVPPQWDDWAVALTSADVGVDSAIILYNWAIELLGGAVPIGQTLVLPSDRSVSALLTFFEKILGAVHRRLYVFASGLPYMTAKRVIDLFEHVADRFEEIVVIGEIELEGPVNEGGFLSFNPNGLFLRFDATGEAFANAVVEGLNGQAVGEDGVVTASSLTRYLTETISLTAAGARWQTWGTLSPLVASDDFALFVEFRSHLGPMAVAIRNDRGKIVLVFELSGTVVRQRMAHGLYSVDVPKRSLLLRFDTTLVNSVDVVPQSREEWIIVAGTAGEVTEPQRLFAQAFGRRLAGAGYRLLVGDWHGVDTITIDSFAWTLARLDVKPDESMRRFMLQPQREQQYPGVVNVVVHTKEDEFERPLREAHAIVLIGGLGGTYEYAMRAARAGVPVIPIAPTGGDAAKLFHAGGPGIPDAVRDAPWQHEEIQDEEQADAMAMRAVELLIDHIKPWRQSEPPAVEAAAPAIDRDPATSPIPVRLFVGYAHNDESHLEHLDLILTVLERQHGLTAWRDHRLIAGQEWDDHIRERLEEMDIFLFIASQASVASTYIKEVELRRAKERHDAGEIEIVIVKLEPYAYEDPFIGKLQRLAPRFRSVAEAPLASEVWEQVRKDLLPVIEHVREKKMKRRSRLMD